MTWPSKKRFWRWAFALGVVIVILGASIARHSMADWRTASRAPAGIAPDPAEHSEAIVQVYAARAYSWRGVFGVHTWIAVKPTGAPEFKVYEVTGWRVYHGYPAVSISNRAADGRWFGSVPEILADIRGPEVDDMIKRIDTASRSYPYMDQYHVWPGPNSNTFVAHVARAVPELKLDLPPTAIGKDFIPGGKIVAPTPSGTGYQVSFFGLLGLLASTEEGVEVNFLGLTFGIDPMDLAIKLPLAGRLGGSS